MENNCIQMAASGGHAVAYTLNPIFAAVFHQWLHEYCPLKRQLSLACQRNTYLWRTLQIIVQRCQIAVPRWPNDISSVADNVIFKNRTQNIGCVARNAVANILLFNFCEQKLAQHSPITIAIGCNGLTLLIFETKWPNYNSEPNDHQTKTRFVCVGFPMYACGFSGLQRPKWDSSEKMIYFCPSRHVL